MCVPEKGQPNIISFCRMTWNQLILLFLPKQGEWMLMSSRPLPQMVIHAAGVWGWHHFLVGKSPFWTLFLCLTCYYLNGTLLPCTQPVVVWLSEMTVLACSATWIPQCLQLVLCNISNKKSWYNLNLIKYFGDIRTLLMPATIPCVWVQRKWMIRR